MARPRVGSDGQRETYTTAIPATFRPVLVPPLAALLCMTVASEARCSNKERTLGGLIRSCNRPETVRDYTVLIGTNRSAALRQAPIIEQCLHQEESC